MLTVRITNKTLLAFLAFGILTTACSAPQSEFASRLKLAGLGADPGFKNVRFCLTFTNPDGSTTDLSLPSVESEPGSKVWTYQSAEGRVEYTMGTDFWTYTAKVDVMVNGSHLMGTLESRKFDLKDSIWRGSGYTDPEMVFADFDGAFLVDHETLTVHALYADGIARQIQLMQNAKEQPLHIIVAPIGQSQNILLTRQAARTQGAPLRFDYDTVTLFGDVEFDEPSGTSHSQTVLKFRFRDPQTKSPLPVERSLEIR